MARFAEKYMVPNGSNTSTTVGSNEPDIPIETGSFVGSVVRIIPEACIAIINSPIMEDNAQVPYYPDCGIRVGAAVEVSVASNIPRISRVIDFGCENTACLDPLGEEKEGDFFSTKDSESYSPGYEKANGAASSIIHKDSEKVLAADFSGFKAAIDHSIMFYEANARVMCADGIAAMYSNNIVLFSESGSLVFDEPEPGETIGVHVQTVFEIEGKGNDREAFEIFKEYKGNVRSGLKEDNITIPKFPGSIITVSDLVYLMVIIDVDVSKYEQSVSEVTHSYIKRKLEIQGGKSTDVLLNSAFSGKDGLNLTEEDMKSRAIVAKKDSVDVAVVYVKGVSRTGDVYEFSAGEACSVHSEPKNISIKERKDFMMSDYTQSFQGNYSRVQFPIMEDSVIRKEDFGTNIVEIKGIANHNFYKETIFKKINTTTIYEVLPDTDIETMEFKSSPIIVTDTNNMNIIVKKHSDIDKNVMATTNLTNDGVSTVLVLDAENESKVQIVTNKGAENSVLYIGNKGFITETKGVSVHRAKTLYIESGNNVMRGMLTLLDGINIMGDFFINAENIFMIAKSQFGIIGENVYIDGKKSITAVYKDYFIISSDNEEINSEGEPRMASMLWMNKFNTYIQSDGTQIYGKEFINAFGNGNGAFGAETATFFGGII